MGQEKLNAFQEEERGQSDVLCSVFSKDHLAVVKWSTSLVECEPGTACGTRLGRVWAPSR